LKWTIFIHTANEKIARFVARRSISTKLISRQVNLSFPWLNDEGLVKVVRLTLEDAVAKFKKSREAEGLSKSATGIFQDASNDLMDLLGKNIGSKDTDSLWIAISQVYLPLLN